MTSASVVAATAGALAGLALAHLWLASDQPAGGWTGLPHGDRAAAARRRRAVHPLGPLLAGAAVGWAVLGSPGIVLGAILGIGAGRAGAARSQRRAARLRERGVGALARSLSDAVRAGHSVRGALHAAALDQAVPAALRRVVVQGDAALQRGAPLPAALRHLGAQGGPQLVLLCAVVALHAERGGRLPYALDRLAEDADRAVRLDEERAAATAQARATVRTVAALPLLALAGAQLVGGDLLGAVAEHPASLALLITGLALEVAAVVIAQRLVAATA